jgi:thiol-disulfide isomerase/thioredoxin
MRDPRLLLLATLSLLALPLAAQVPPPQSLEDLQRAFEAQHRSAAMATVDNPMEQFRTMMARQIGELEQFLAHEARGDDRFNGRLMLVDMHMSLAAVPEAKAALLGMDAQASPALILLVAADVANRLGLTAKRQEWIEAALAKDSGFEERMEAARMLMTLLVEVDRGQAIFDTAMAGATNDEDRAKILWYQSIAIREREDLEEDSYHLALEELADKYPETYYGGIARDRVMAADLRVGEAPIPFSTTDIQGRPVTLGDYQGKVLLLQFWASWEPSREILSPALVALYAANQDRGFEILGISLDRDRGDMERALAEDGSSWPQVFDGKMWQSEMALRYAVEVLPYALLIGRNGKIAGMNLYPNNPESIAELTELITQNLAKDGL